MGKSRGFTIFEVIIVFAIFIVITNIIILRFNNSEKFILNNACIQLKDEIRYIQRLAMSENKKYTLESLNDTGYLITYEKNGKKIKHSVKNLPHNINFLRDNSVSYTNLGSVVTGTTFILTYNYKFTCEITVTPSSGRVEIKNIK